MAVTSGRLAALAAVMALAVACGGDQPASPSSASLVKAGGEGQSGTPGSLTSGGSVAAADDGEIIYACKLNSGILKVVEEGDTCPEGQTPFQWNAVGPAGPAGAPGADGADGVSGYEVVRSDFELEAGGFLRQFVACPAGKKALGGGAQVAEEGTSDFKTVLQESTPGTVGGDQSGWLVAMRNDDTAAHTIAIQVTCASVL